MSAARRPAQAGALRQLAFKRCDIPWYAVAMRIGFLPGLLGLGALVLWAQSPALAQPAAASAPASEPDEAEPDEAEPDEAEPDEGVPGVAGPGGPPPGPVQERSFEFPGVPGASATQPQTPGIGSVPSATPLTPGALASPASEVVEVTQAVPATDILGIGLVPHHYDAAGYAESPEGLLIIELDPQVGPITMFRGTQPHYIEAQFVNTQRDAVWLARQGVIRDVLPNGQQYAIPYGYGAIKRSLVAMSLVEAQLQPHISDNQKSYELFPLEDLYLGGVASLAGLRAEVRYVQKESFVGYAQAGINLPAIAGLEFNRTYGSYAVPIIAGGGFRYPALLSVLGTNWTSGVEFLLGVGDVDGDDDTPGAVLVPGLVQEFEWAFERDISVTDYRSDPRPANYGVQSVFGKAGFYADFLGATKGILFDVHVGYRFNLEGPKIPPHKFKETRITYASERYVARKLEEKRRQAELDALRRRREEQAPPTGTPYPVYPAPGTAPAAPYPAPSSVPPAQLPAPQPAQPQGQRPQHPMQ